MAVLIQQISHVLGRACCGALLGVTGSQQLATGSATTLFISRHKDRKSQPQQTDCWLASNWSAVPFYFILKKGIVQVNSKSHCSLPAVHKSRVKWAPDFEANLPKHSQCRILLLKAIRNGAFPWAGPMTASLSNNTPTYVKAGWLAWASKQKRESWGSLELPQSNVTPAEVTQILVLVMRWLSTVEELQLF